MARRARYSAYRASSSGSITPARWRARGPTLYPSQTNTRGAPSSPCAKARSEASVSSRTRAAGCDRTGEVVTTTVTPPAPGAAPAPHARIAPPAPSPPPAPCRTGG